MSQITSGVRLVLSSPVVYSFFQSIMGAKQGKKSFISNYLKPKSGDKILDIGCGPADILNFLPEDIEYWGYDISDEYIEKAKQKFATRGVFTAKLLDRHDLKLLPKFDHVILTGVFHHLDDDVACTLVKLAHSALKKGGKVTSKDPCYSQGQNPIARYLISKDRGQNVRNAQQYRALLSNVFENVSVDVVHKAWIPYTHCYMVGTK